MQLRWADLQRWPLCLCSLFHLFSSIPILYVFFVMSLRLRWVDALYCLSQYLFVPIGLDLWSGGGNASPDIMFARLAIGTVTIVILTFFMLFGNVTLKLWSPIIALFCGYIISYFTGQLHFEHALHASWIGLPPFEWPGLEVHITGMHIPLLFAFGMAMMASMIENTGNIMLVQQISTRDFRRVSYDQVQGGLYCDGLSKVAGGLMGNRCAFDLLR